MSSLQYLLAYVQMERLNPPIYTDAVHNITYIILFLFY